MLKGLKGISPQIIRMEDLSATLTLMAENLKSDVIALMTKLCQL